MESIVTFESRERENFGELQLAFRFPIFYREIKQERVGCNTQSKDVVF